MFMLFQKSVCKGCRHRLQLKEIDSSTSRVNNSNGQECQTYCILIKNFGLNGGGIKGDMF